MTAKQFYEWKAFYDLEPFGDDWQDLRTASIVQAILDPKRQSPLEDFRIARKQVVRRPEGKAIPLRPTQSWQTTKHVAKLIVAAFNANAKRKARKRPQNES
jgi:hypothetical protein